MLIEFTRLRETAENEAKRPNASIWDALVDGTVLKWEHFKPFDDLTDEEIKKLYATEVKEREAICMEKNAWEVAKQVTALVNYYANAKTGLDAAKQPVPGYCFFKKMYSFIANVSLVRCSVNI